MSDRQKRPHTGAAFIHSQLDDCGLTASQFRIYCHIVRRQKCYASVNSMARFCRLHPKTVRASVALLADRRMIAATKRTGQTTLYEPTAMRLWMGHPSQNSIGVDPPQNDIGHPPQNNTGHPPQNDIGKVTPSEVTPSKGVPPPVESDEYRSLKDWQLRKDIKDLEKRLERETGSITRDSTLVAVMRADLAKLRNEAKRRLAQVAAQTADQPKRTRPKSGPWAALEAKLEAEALAKKQAEV